MKMHIAGRTRTCLISMLLAGLVLSGGTTTAVLGDPAAAKRPAGIPDWTGLHRCSSADLDAYRCGTLSVPLDRGPGTDHTRTLDLAVLEAGNPDASRVLLVLTGGPGQPGPALAPRVLPAFAAVTDDFRVVMLDQRGTGRSALDCPKLQTERGGSDLTVPTTEAVRACARTLGPDRAHYATTDSVADLEDLRRALGVDRWAVDGVSYGTYTAQRYAAAHRTRVSHLVLDSVVPVTSFDAGFAPSFSEYARVLRDVCGAVGRDCPGDPAADLHRTLTRHPGLGPRMLDLVTMVAYADPQRFLDLPERLHAAASGDLGPVNEAWRLLHGAFAAPAEEYSQGVQASTFCLDAHFPWGGAQSPVRVRDRRADTAARRLEPSEVFPFNAETARGNGIMAMCEAWPQERDKVVPHPDLTIRDVPTLLLAGERDLGTPLAWARQAHAHIPGSRLIVVPDAGHSLQVGRDHPEINDTVADFLRHRVSR